jgi:hypothetical protein
MAERAEMILDGIDVSAATGLELGPLTAPIVARDHGPIRYIDHLDTDALRARYREHIGFDLDAIVPIDYVIDTTIAAAVGPDTRFDYMVASHVIEHVPDLVAWLADVRSVLADGGLLALAVPDHRRCFDALRAPTVLAEVVEAHLLGRTTPSPRQVFDHYASAVARGGRIIWGDDAALEELSPVHSEAEALELAVASANGTGFGDAHCWVFSPTSFAAVLAGLRRLGLLAFDVVRCTDTVGGEFFATLRASAKEVAPHDAGVAERISEAASVRYERDLLRRSVHEASSERAAVSAELEATRATLSWRITRPLRAARRGRRIS